MLLILAVFGMVVAALALREHYREYGDSPCSINEHWDCGVVNHSKYALVGGAVPALKAVPVLGALPVATAGILGYLVMAGLAWFRAYRVLLALHRYGAGVFALSGDDREEYSGSVVHLLRDFAGDHWRDVHRRPRRSHCGSACGNRGEHSGLASFEGVLFF